MKNKWSKEVINHLHLIYKKSHVLSEYHRKTAILYDVIYRFIGLLNSLITAISAIMLTIPRYSICTINVDDKVIYSLIIGFSTLLTIIQQFFNLNSKFEKSMEFSKKYNLICSRISQQLLMNNNYRELPDKFLLNILENMNDYILKEPIINYIVYYFNKDIEHIDSLFHG